MATASIPAREDEIADAIRDAVAAKVPLQIVGGGSKSGFGAPTNARTLSMAGFTGVVDYDPAELVLTVRPGTLLSEVQALVYAEGQMLAFEPFDHGPIYGQPSGRATIGGVVAAGVSGSQRVSSGAARDHLLGFRAVSGRGEAFVAGAKVVKNVTGYDLPKIAAGSWGRLFAVTELTLKVLPRPRVTATRIIEGLSDAEALRTMALAMGSQAEVAAAAHIPARAGNPATTAFRIQGFGPSVAARCLVLEQALGRVGTPGEEQADAIWDDLRTLHSLGIERALWRVNVAPSAASTVLDAMRPTDADWLADWAGGLFWLAFDGDAALIRDAAIRAGGHATLVRGTDAMRSAVPAFHPPATGLAALEARVRRALDPDGVFETGRF